VNGSVIAPAASGAIDRRPGAGCLSYQVTFGSVVLARSSEDSSCRRH
jgi:hypothetical protein